MLTAIYGDKNGTQDSIAWWLCEEDGIGPQIYNAPWRTGKIQAKFDNPMLGTLVEDCRLYEEHDETMRLMENTSDDFLQPWRQHESAHTNLVWSNYFGCLLNPQQKIISDKLILCRESQQEDCFHYIISHAFKMLTADKIDDDSEVWWRDHVYVDGKHIGDWHKIWYSLYHNKMLTAHSEGKLRYMWQLNYMHWDLFHAIQEGKATGGIELCSPHDYHRLFQEKLEPQPTVIEQTISSNTGLVVDDPNWFTSADAILDYLNIAWTDSLRQNLTEYTSVYTQKRQWYDERFKLYL